MLSKNTILNIFLLSFLTSILVNNYLQEFLLSFFILIFFIIFLTNLFIYKKFKIKFIFIYIFLVFWYIFWLFVSLNNLNEIKSNSEFLDRYYLWNNNYNFTINELYKKWENYNSYIVKIDKIWNIIVDKNIFWLVYIAPNFKLDKYDKINTEAKILIIDNIDTFDYKNYLLSKNIYFKVYLYEFNLLSKWNWFLHKLENFRNKILTTINTIFPSDEAILLSWILIWAREDIPEDLRNSFNNSWTTHFIAVSWYNITILIIFLWYFFKFIPLFVRSLIIICSLIVFCFFVWLEASVVRAWIMWILGYLITVSWRKQISITLLLLTAFLMVLYNPFYINYDVSFHLSFFAVIWLLYFKDYFDKIFSFLPNTLAIKESFSLTMAAMLATLPIIVFNFGQISLLTPISNIAFAWTIPFIMLFWFLSVVLYFIFPFLWILFWFITFIFLKWDILVVYFFWNLDKYILKIDFHSYGIYLEILYFILLIFLILYKNKNA